jgi:hypothetical protein
MREGKKQRMAMPSCVLFFFCMVEIYGCPPFVRMTLQTGKITTKNLDKNRQRHLHYEVPKISACFPRSSNLFLLLTFIFQWKKTSIKQEAQQKTSYEESCFFTR